MSLRLQWESAYLATTYEVESSERCWKLRIGLSFPAWDAWLKRQRVTSWAMLTAVNPGSQALSSEENQERQRLLHQQLQDSGFWWLSGRSYGDNGLWEVEPMVWIANLSLQEAVRLSRQWQQAAFVWSEKQGDSELCFLDEFAESSPTKR